MLEIGIKTKELRDNIIKDYKTLKIFGERHNIPYHKLTLAINDKDASLLKKVKHTYDSNKVNSVPGYIRVEDRKAIRICILSNHDNYTAFSKEHPLYNMVYITNIVKGNLTKETEKYKKLVLLLKMQYGLQLTERKL